MKAWVMSLAFAVLGGIAVAQGTEEAAFWEDILAAEAGYAARLDAPVPMVAEINARLAEDFPGLVFELGPPGPDGRRQFVISADGLIQYFAQVEALVGAAPELAHFDVVAFRQPEPEFVAGFSVDYLGRRYFVEEFQFALFGTAKPYDIVLTHPAFAQRRDGDVGAAFLMLDRAIGEYRVATEMGGINFVPASDVPAGTVLLPLTRFREAMGE